MDESESEAEVGAEEEKQRAQKEEVNGAAASHKHVATAVMAPSGIKGHQKTHGRPAEEVGPLCYSLV